MSSVPPLLTFLLMAVSGWVHRHQLRVIEFLQAENRMLKERLRGKRVRFIATPHVPHGWEAQVIYEETTGTLLCGDLLSQLGPAPWPE